MPIAPYIGTHIVAILFLIAAWRWPRIARFVTGAGFIVAGGYNIWTAITSPSIYVAGFGAHAFPLYRMFIYGVFARHTISFVIAIAVGQIAVGGSMFASLRLRKLGYVGAIVFLLAITPLGFGSAAPSTLIFAVGITLLLRFDVKCSALASDRQFADCR